ncbi:MAG: hypothetical protein ABI846_03780 [Rudaea sp.]
MSIRIQTQAFAVVDDDGNHTVIVRTTPMRADESGVETPVELGIELKLRDGASVMAISETEFETAQGKRWRVEDRG